VQCGDRPSGVNRQRETNRKTNRGPIEKPIETRATEAAIGSGGHEYKEKPESCFFSFFPFLLLYSTLESSQQSVSLFPYKLQASVISLPPRHKHVLANST